MSWRTLDPAVREAVEATLTEKQLEAFRLYLAGWSTHAMALALHIDRRAIRDRLDAARRNLARAGVEQSSTGEWTINKEAAA